jgi:hypothetical protein
MKVLIACEESQKVCKAFRDRGHEAYSCDVQPCSGGHPEWHIQDDVRKHLDEGWDLMIAHPECRYLCWSGERWMKNNPEREIKRFEAYNFLRLLYYADIKKIAIEQSLSYFLIRNWKKPTQMVHPFHFGDPFRKTTMLYLRGLKPLMPTNIVWKREAAVHNEWPSKNRSKIRATTYFGIANAMAEQWG